MSLDRGAHANCERTFTGIHLKDFCETIVSTPLVRLHGNQPAGAIIDPLLPLARSERNDCEEIRIVVDPIFNDEFAGQKRSIAGSCALPVKSLNPPSGAW